MADLYAAPNHANLLFNQLGIDINNQKMSFDPNNQPKQIGAQFHNAGSRKTNKYIEQRTSQSKQQQNYSQDHQIPKILKPQSNFIKKSQPQQKQQPKKGRRKQPKKFDKKMITKNQIQLSKNQKQINMNIETDQVAQWGEKGTKVNNQNDEQQFDIKLQNMAQYHQNNKQKQQIRKRIQQKLKKYQQPNSSQSKQSSKGSSLQTKLQQLKKKKNEVTVLGQTFHHNSMDQISQQQIVKPQSKQQKKNEQMVIKNKVIEQQQDPWEKINQKTLAKKNQQKNALKNAQEIDLNKFYQNLSLAQLSQSQQNIQPQTGFFQSICACLSPKKKSYNQVQKQLIKISKVQLTNQPQETTLLKSIWIKLTNKKYLRYGEHWSQIGFQGRDPATDLRSTGILSLVTWHNFLNFDIQYGLKIHNFCQQFDIPLALTHIKITSVLCSSIKKRKLQGKIWNDFMQWYYAFTYYTFDYLLQKVKKLDEIRQLIQSALQRTKNNLQLARDYFNKNIKNKR